MKCEQIVVDVLVHGNIEVSNIDDREIYCNNKYRSVLIVSFMRSSLAHAGYVISLLEQVKHMYDVVQCNGSCLHRIV